jgi:hypothetical protein
MSTTNTETENAILSIGSEFLPAAARKVRDGEDLTAAERAEYEVWLAEQVSKMEQE